MNGEIVNEQMILDDEFRIRISSKKLNSGKYQVKFYAFLEENQIYGYTLVDSGTTLKTVVDKIRKRLVCINYSNDNSHFHLFNLNTSQKDLNQIMVFQ